MTKKTPLITIGMTCFNAEDLITKSIEHALKQDWLNYEIVIVDDGSSDSSVKAIKAFIEGQKNVRLIEHVKNKGFPSALNTIVENAKGEYIAFFDDDDTSAPERLTQQYKRLSTFIEKKKSKLVLCYTDRNVKYADKDEIAYSFTAIGGIEGKEPHGGIVADYLLWHSGRPGYQWGMFGSCTLMVHRDLFKDVGTFDPEFRRNTEWDMAIRAALKGAYFIAVKEPLVTQKKTPTQDKAGKKPLMYSLKLRDKYQDYLKGKGVWQAARMIARSRFYGGKGKKINSMIFMFLAILISPHKVGADKVIKLAAKIQGA